MDMRPETLSDLADSIKSQGLVQLFSCGPCAFPNPGESQRYEIIAGERRGARPNGGNLGNTGRHPRCPDERRGMRSSKHPARGLNPLEEARALLRLIRSSGLTHQAAAEAVGRSRAAVSNLLRLMD